MLLLLQMDQSLRAVLTSPRIGCTQEHIAALESEQICTASDVLLLSDADFKAMRIGIATKNRVLVVVQQMQGAVDGRSKDSNVHPRSNLPSAPSPNLLAAQQLLPQQRAATAAKARVDGAKGGKRKAANAQEDTLLRGGGGLQSWLRANRAPSASSTSIPVSCPAPDIASSVRGSRSQAAASPVHYDSDEDLTLDELLQQSESQVNTDATSNPA